jgi:Ca-activated chloride channel family protein
MTFLWPEALMLLAAVPLLVALYIVLLRRKKKAALRYADLGIVKAAMGRQALRRHIPPALFLLATIVGFVALARPTALMRIPSLYETVILSIDISGSMRAKDVDPDRITAAQEAAKAFVAHQPHSTRLGVVAFAGAASLVQPPTQNRQDVLDAIDRLQPQRATAIGAGILVALKAIFPDLEVDLHSPRSRQHMETPPGRRAPSPNQPSVKPVPPGSYGSAVIILLTDGANTSGPNPIEAAKMAADRGVRVYTVGIGTAQGTTLSFDGWSMRVRLDEETLKQIANITRAEYFFTDNAVDLKKIYNTLNSRFTMEKKQTEITVLFSATATLLALLSGGLSLLWFSRIL